MTVFKLQIMTVADDIQKFFLFFFQIFFFYYYFSANLYWYVMSEVKPYVLHNEDKEKLVSSAEVVIGPLSLKVDGTTSLMKSTLVRIYLSSFS